MKQTPFQYLKSNIWRVKFDCDKKYQKVYRETFGKILDAMDKYFTQHKLYDAIDFMPVVENVLDKKNFKFVVGEIPNSLAKAFFHLTPNYKNQYIFCEPDSLTVEIVLAHEFIHYLTLGIQKTYYQENGLLHETERTNRLLRQKGVTKIHTNHPIFPFNLKQLSTDLPYTQTFMNEGLTQSLTNEIFGYTIFAYPDLANMMKFCNELTGQNINYRDFLRGDMPNYINLIGETEFNEFEKLTSQYLQIKDNPDKKRESVRLYLQSAEKLVEGRLRTLSNQQRLKASQIIQVMETIANKSPANFIYYNFDGYKVYGHLIEKSAKIYAENNHIKNKQLFANYILNLAQNRKYENEKILKLELGSEKIGFEITENGFSVIVGGSQKLQSQFFQQNPNSRAYHRSANCNITQSMNSDGAQKFEILNKQTQETTVINVKVDENNPQIFEVFDENMNLIKEFNPEVFARHKARQEALYKQQLNMLDNFNHLDQIKEMIVEHSTKTQSVYKVVKVQSSEGQEYFVANTKNNSYFYKITEQGLESVPVQETQTLEKGKEIKNLLSTGLDKSASLAFYQSTNQKLDEPVPCYVLEDGTRFARYYENDHQVLGELVEAMGKEELIATHSDVIYNRNNKELKQLLEMVQSQKLDIRKTPVQAKESERGARL